MFGEAEGRSRLGWLRRRQQFERSENWWRRRESNTKSAIFRQFFNSLTVRELWSQPVDALPIRSIS